MQKTMDEFVALLGNLTRTCQELEEIKQEQAKDHKRISRSFERALLSIQHQKQSIINQVEEEYDLLRDKLASLQRVNEHALQEGISEINSMVQQIARVSSQLQSQNSSEDNMAIMKEIHERIAVIFNKNRSIIIRLKKVQFAPSPLPAPALGEVHYEEQTFGFSIPYVEGREYTSVNGTTAGSPMLSDEPPPWELASSDSGSVENGCVYDRKASPEGDCVGSIQKERNGSRGQLVEKGLSGERIAATREETFISPKATSGSDTDTNAPSTRTVSKIKISDTESSCSATDSEEKSPSSTGDDRAYARCRTIKEDRLCKQSPVHQRHSIDCSVLTDTTRSTLRGVPSQMSPDRNCTPKWSSRGVTATALMDNQAPQATETGSANLQNQVEPTGTNGAVDSSFFNFKTNRFGAEVCSRHAVQFSSISEGESAPFPEKETTRPYNTNISKSAKREHEEHAAERKLGVCDLISQFSNLNAQNNSVEPTPCAEAQTPNNLQPPSSLDLAMNEDSVFRATTAFVYEDDSDNSVDGSDDKRTEERDKESKAFRVVAIPASRVSPEKRISSKEKLIKWNSIDFGNNLEMSVADNSVCAAEESPLQPSDPIPSQFNRFSHNRVGVLERKKMAQRSEDQLKSFKLSDQELALVQRSPSPTDSVNSSYTFIIESPKDDRLLNGGLQPGLAARRERKRLPETPNERARRGRPVIGSCVEPKVEKSPVQNSPKKQLERNISSPSNAQHPGAPGADIRRGHFANSTRTSRTKTPDYSENRAKKAVSRSSSMPVIDKLSKGNRGSPCSPSVNDRRDSTSSTASSNANTRRSSLSAASRAVNSALRRGRRPQSGRVSRQSSENFPQHLQRTRTLSKSESCLMGDTVEEEDGPYTNMLVGQFSKFGSGRGELNLPHGLHTTLMGALYIVDYGNRRVQVMDCKGSILQQITLANKNYFDIAVNNKGLVALTNSSDRTVEVYSKYGKLLQIISKNMNTPRGITSNFRDEFVIADMRLGTLTALTLDLTSGSQLESTVIPGFNKPYLLSANNQGLVAVSERGFDGGSCVKVLNDDWQVVRVLGQKGGLGPALFNPWGVCLDNEGDVLVADWGQTHSVIHYPMRGPARAVVTDGLSSPRGLAVLQDHHHLLVADSMHNCIKVFRYK